MIVERYVERLAAATHKPASALAAHKPSPYGDSHVTRNEHHYSNRQVATGMSAGICALQKSVEFNRSSFTLRWVEA